MATIPPEKVQKDFRERLLIPELPGILNWALEGLRAYLEAGLHPPPAVLGATDEYRHDMDVVGQWIDDRCVRNSQGAVPTAEAYSDYMLWSQNEIGWSLSKLKFRRILSDRGFGADKGTGGQRLICGLRLKPGSPFLTPVARG